MGTPAALAMVIVCKVVETNGAVQWDPDVYAPPHTWVHASDWEAPEHEIVCGPVFCMFRRWAPLPHLADVMDLRDDRHNVRLPDRHDRHKRRRAPDQQRLGRRFDNNGRSLDRVALIDNRNGRTRVRVSSVTARRIAQAQPVRSHLRPSGDVGNKRQLPRRIHRNLRHRRER